MSPHSRTSFAKSTESRRSTKRSASDTHVRQHGYDINPPPPPLLLFSSTTFRTKVFCKFMDNPWNVCSFSQNSILYDFICTTLPRLEDMARWLYVCSALQKRSQGSLMFAALHRNKIKSGECSWDDQCKSFLTSKPRREDSMFVLRCLKKRCDDMPQVKLQLSGTYESSLPLPWWRVRDETEI